MAMSIEDIFGLFTLDSGNIEKTNTEQAADTTQDLISFASESENPICSNFDEKENGPPDTHIIILEENFSKQPESNFLPINIDETHEKATEDIFRKTNDIPDILASAYESVKSNKKEIDKMNRRVHFNTQVETFTYEPELGINENYNSIEEFTIENVCGDTFNEKRMCWKSESNLAVRDAYFDYPIVEGWFRCDHRYHQLRNGHLYIPQYSNLDDDGGITDSPKNWPGLKRTSSCFFRKKKNENQNEPSGSVSGSFNRRLSISMHNLKMETKALIDTLWTKVTKKKDESFPISEFSWAGDIIQVPMEEKKSKPRSTKTRNNLIRKKKREDENGSPCGNIPLRSWKSMQDLNRKKNITALNCPKFYEEDIADGFEKKTARLKRKNSLFCKRTCDGESVSGNSNNQTESNSAMTGNFDLRSWKSVQNLKSDSKSWMDKFVTKVMKK